MQPSCGSQSSTTSREDYEKRGHWTASRGAGVVVVLQWRTSQSDIRRQMPECSLSLRWPISLQMPSLYEPFPSSVATSAIRRTSYDKDVTDQRIDFWRRHQWGVTSSDMFHVLCWLRASGSNGRCGNAVFMKPTTVRRSVICTSVAFGRVVNEILDKRPLHGFNVCESANWLRSSFL